MVTTRKIPIRHIPMKKGITKTQSIVIIMTIIIMIMGIGDLCWVIILPGVSLSDIIITILSGRIGIIVPRGDGMVVHITTIIGALGAIHLMYMNIMGTMTGDGITEVIQSIVIRTRA